MKKFLCLFAIAVSIATFAVAQPDGFDEVAASQDVPLDGGVSLLLAGTAAYGIKRMRNKQQRQK